MSGVAGYVRITNGTGTKIVGRYDGTDYTFLPSKPTDVPEVVASHIFGFRVPDKMNVLARLGWLTNSAQLEEAQARLGKVRFEAIEMVGQVADDEDLGASSEDMAPEGIGTASPSVTAGGTSGVGSPAPGAPTDAEPDVI